MPLNSHLCLFFVSFWIAWITLAFFNFGYPLWYELLQIEAFIQEMGPENRYMPYFHLLNKADYVRLFEEINIAIHLAPNLLGEIQYSISLQSGTHTYPLLRKPEIIHLEDVARLIRFLHYFGAVNAVILILLLYGHIQKLKNIQQEIEPKKQRKYFFIVWSIIIFACVTIAVTEPTALFYWLHELAFPENHQWFFYYQESLMTTLMKAPDLFGGIAFILLITTLLFHIVLNQGLKAGVKQVEKRLSSGR